MRVDRRTNPTAVIWGIPFITVNAVYLKVFAETVVQRPNPKRFVFLPFIADGYPLPPIGFVVNVLTSGVHTHPPFMEGGVYVTVFSGKFRGVLPMETPAGCTYTPPDVVPQYPLLAATITTKENVQVTSQGTPYGRAGASFASIEDGEETVFFTDNGRFG